jgi:hypothetical protein
VSPSDPIETKDFSRPMSFDDFNCNGPARAIRVRDDDWRWWRRS